MKKGVFGVFAGEQACLQPKRVLILGESHHWSDTDGDNKKSEAERREKEAAYRTENVIKNYLCNQEREPYTGYFIFDKIVKTCGYSEKDRASFWSKVFFANYVDDCLCGIGDSAAKNAVRGRRTKYNDSLFTFINDHQIDIVFCFSRLAFNNLPSLASKDEDGGRITKDIFVRGKRDYIGLCHYKANTAHRHTTVELEKDLEAYSLRHPSSRGGYEIDNYAPVISRVFKESTK